MFTLCLLKVGPINQNFYNSRPDFVDGLKLVKLKVMDNTIIASGRTSSVELKSIERDGTRNIRPAEKWSDLAKISVWAKVFPHKIWREI